MTDSNKITRRRHSAELKALVLDECAQPGASVAAIAMAHGINANVVHKWRRIASGAPSAPQAPPSLHCRCRKPLQHRRRVFASNCAAAP